MRYLSIKVRMTIWFTLLMVVLSTLMLIFVMLMNRNQVTKPPAAQLLSVVQRNVDEIEMDHGVLDLSDVDVFRHGVYTLLYDRDGALRLGAAPPELTEELPLQGGAMRTARGTDGDYYVYDQYVEDAGLWVRGIISRQARGGVMEVIVPLAWSLLPGLIVVSALGGFLIAWLSFRPLEKVISLAEHISGGDDLTRRVPLPRGGRSEVHRLAGAFNGMCDRLERSFEAERQFTSDASHELRTPVAVILAECDSLSQGQPEAEDYRQSLAVIRRQGQQMSQLLGQLLSITRLEQGTQKLQLEQADLSQLVEILCQEQAQLAPAGTELTARVEPGICLQADVTLLSRLLSNLISNAYRYGRPGGHVWVELTRQADCACLSVRDDGIGIPPEQQEKIFQRFYQVDGARGRQGSGLGLFMVQQIARLHGGSVQVESQPGQGSTFTVRLPL